MRGTAGREPALSCHLLISRLTRPLPPLSAREAIGRALITRPMLNLEAFPTDPDLPQLKIATDPVLMREVFRGYLRQLPGRAYYVQDCLLSWVRYFRSARCTLQYTLRLVEPRTGDERTQWLTGVIDADGRSERIWQKLRFTSLEQEIPEGLLTFEPVSFISDLRMLVQVFPFDRRLPALPILMAGPSPDLERLLLTRFGPGDWQAEAWNIEPIRYRVGARAVLQYAVQARDAATGRRGEKRFYVKVYRDEEGERTYQALQTLWRRSEARGDSFTVGMPIAYLSSLHTLLQGRPPGPHSSNSFSRAAIWWRRCAKPPGPWLS